MTSRGMKASELVKHLKEQMRQHGDLPVFHGGGDYPEGVSGVAYRSPEQGDGYVPGNTFLVF